MLLVCDFWSGLEGSVTVTYTLWVVLECIISSVMVASSGESSGGARHPPPPFILGKKEEMTEGRKVAG